jgi:molybdate transport system regulatory protein
MAIGSIMAALPTSETPAGAPVRLTLRIDLPNGRKFGHGKAQLLDLVRAHGSISAAGRAMNMSYRRAWLLIEEVNTMFAAPLVKTQAGGPGGGGAALTLAGEQVLNLYRALEVPSPQAEAILQRILQLTAQ